MLSQKTTIGGINRPLPPLATLLPTSKPASPFPSNARDIPLAQPQRATAKPADTGPADAALPLLAGILGLILALLLQDDAVLAGLAAAGGLLGGGLGVDALAVRHGHLLLLEDGRLGAEGLDA